jgi:hypothetical protein
MTDQLEPALRAALQERAAEVPAASVARLHHLDYHPRTRRLRPPVAIGALASAAGTAGAVAIVISLSAGASSAFAGWSPKPTAPAPDQLATAGADCQTQSPIAGLPLKLADTRGPFTFSVYADSNSSATCINGPGFVAVSGNESSAPIAVPAGRILLSSSHTSNRAGAAYSFADGRAGDGVSAVVLTLDDGTQVQATVANGWFVAWWPGAQGAKSAAITTPTGVATQTFPAQPQIPCGPQPCPPGASSQSSGFSGGGGRASGFSEVSGSGQGGPAGQGGVSGQDGGSGQAGAQSYSRSR